MGSFYVFKWNLVLFTIYSNLPKLLVYQTRTPNKRALAGSTFGGYGRFRSGLKTKQEPVDSLNL